MTSKDGTFVIWIRQRQSCEQTGAQAVSPRLHSLSTADCTVMMSTSLRHQWGHGVTGGSDSLRMRRDRLYMSDRDE